MAASASTPAFTPTFSDPLVSAGQLTPGTNGTLTFQTQQTVASGATPTITYYPVGGSAITLPSSDYSAPTGSGQKITITLSSQNISAIETAANQTSLTGYFSVSYQTAANQPGYVTVQEGAQLTSPANTSGVGGKIALIGENVTNAGTISTPDGQTILAAGDQVGLVAHNSNDATLRGLDVYVGAVNSGDGNATNAGISDDGSGGEAFIAKGSEGLINAQGGDVLITGETVNQDGFINSTTSVSLNGRVDLLADYRATSNASLYDQYPLYDAPFIYSKTGSVQLGANSVTEILPDGNATVIGEQLALGSIVNIQGNAINLLKNAVILAPSATPDGAKDSEDNTLTAGVSLCAGNWYNQTTIVSLIYNNPDNMENITLASGAMIDVAGSTNVNASASQDLVSAQLLGTELADDPLQRNGILRGQTVNVDVLNTGSYDGQEWVGTPLADVTGYVNLIGRTVGELTIDGGTVALKAGNKVTLSKGSTIDVSGGWINYQGAYLQTSEVETGGHLYSISQASPDLVYDGIYDGLVVTDAKWGVTDIYNSPLTDGGYYQPGYLQGGSGGTITIQAASADLEGAMYGNTVSGPYQRTSLGATTNPAPGTINYEFAGNAALDTMQWLLAAPSPSTFSLTLANQTVSGAWESSSPQQVVIGKSDNPVSANNPTGDVVLSPALVNSDGFGIFEITNKDGNIIVGNVAGGAVVSPASLTAEANSASQISLQGANITIAGRISAPGGNISLTVYDISPYLTGLTSAPTVVSGCGQFTLEDGSTLSTAGLVINDALDGFQPIVTSGGSVAISGYYVDLQQGSTINVSGGGEISTAGKAAYGSGGSISITGGQDPTYKALGQYASGGASTPYTSGGVYYPGQLILGSTLLGYSGGKGGSLTIQAPLIQIGGSTLGDGWTLGSNGEVVYHAGAVCGDGTVLWLDKAGAPDFFSQGGFTSFSINGTGNIATADASYQSLGVYVAANTTINPQVESLLAVPGSGGSGVVLQTTMLPASLRDPVSISLEATGILDTVAQAQVVFGNLTMEAGSKILVAPGTSEDIIAGGQISVTSQFQTTLLGDLVAPGGTLSVSGGTPNLDQPTLILGDQCRLSAAGELVLTPNPLGYASGSVLPGGQITVSGNIVAEEGALLNVSGAAGVLDVTPENAGSSKSLGGSAMNSLVPVQEDSNGGTIILKGGNSLFTDATLLGKPGMNPDETTTAMGGSLIVSSGFYNPAGKNGSGDTNPDFTTVGAIPAPTLEITQGLAQILQQVGVTPTTYQTVTGISGFSGSTELTGGGYFDADSFEKGGFASLTLKGNVEFSGNVTLTAKGSLVIASGGVIFADATKLDTITLSAPYVDLGTGFLTPNSTVSPTPAASLYPYGCNFSPSSFYSASANGTLTVNATTLVDVGNLALLNIGTATLSAAPYSGGAIRGDGSLEMAGSLILDAGQVYPVTGATFTIAADNYTGGTGSVTIEGPQNANEVPAVPLSAGGVLNIYASVIVQDGVLRAPFGQINLGCSAASAPTDPVTNLTFPTATSVTLSQGGVFSLTSVSAVNLGASTANGLLIPYGTNDSGTDWIDPAGDDLTTAGIMPAVKQVNISGGTIQDNKGATNNSGAIIDLRGGGDLYSYQWISGTGGTKDILNTTNEFAVIPAYRSAYAPDDYTSGGTYENASLNTGGLQVGEQVYLAASNGLPAGVYTLLPARYALLPGAFLVTPEGSSGVPYGAVSQADGSSVVPGYKFNGFAQSPSGQQQYSAFLVEPQSLVRASAQYDIYYANSFLPASAAANNLTLPRLPVDAGQAVFNASASFTFGGTMLSAPAAGGLGSIVDITTADNIVIGNYNDGASMPSTTAGTLYLDSQQLDSLNAASLLIGGYRETESNTIVATTTNLMVNNAGEPLSGPDVILVSNQTLLINPGSVIQSTGNTPGSAQNYGISDSDSISSTGLGGGLTFANGGVPILFPSGAPSADKLYSTVAGVITLANGQPGGTISPSFAFTLSAGETVTLNSPGEIYSKSTTAITPIPVIVGDGVLLRVSSDPNAGIIRSGVASLKTVGGVSISLTIAAPTATNGASATITGASVTLDSTALATLDPNTNFTDTANPKISKLSLDAGVINLDLLPSTSTVTIPPGMTLTQQALSNLENHGITNLSLLSYSSIDIYGDGTIGSPALNTLALHTAEIRGFYQTDGDTAMIEAQNIILDNSADFTGPGAVQTQAGKLEFTNGIDSKGTITLGVNSVAIDQFASVELNAGGEITSQGTGILNVGLGGDTSLALSAPLITGATGANQSITASGAVTIVSAGAAPAGSSLNSLGASLSMTGATIDDYGNIVLPSGNLTLHAESANSTGVGLAIGDNGAAVIDVSGIEKSFYDAKEYTFGGQVSLAADEGAIDLGQGNTVSISVAAPTGGGNAGTLSISAPNGTFAFQNTTLNGSGGLGGQAGAFNLDVATVGSPALGSPTDLTALESLLAPNAGDFTNSQTIRIRTGNVSVSAVTAHAFNLSADVGVITVNGWINASGITGDATASGAFIPNADGLANAAYNGAGGTINLEAGGNVILGSNAILDAQGYAFNDAGQGGAITLQAGCAEFNSSGVQTTQTGAGISLEAGSQILLGVGSTWNIRQKSISGIYYNALAGEYESGNSGVLTLIAPQVLDSNGNPTGSLNISGGTPGSPAPITSSQIIGASRIAIVGNNVINANPTNTPNPNASIDYNCESAVASNGQEFVTNASTSGFLASLLGANAAQTESVFYNSFLVEPGEEIVNTNGGLALSSNGWNLAQQSNGLYTYRFGTGNNVAGLLTLRASGNITFNGSLSDGFSASSSSNLWQETLLPAGSQSWSYQITAGADFTAANSSATVNLTGAAASTMANPEGSVILGKYATTAPTSVTSTYYQVIRTGAGNISISAAGDVDLDNQFASIYTAGTLAPNQKLDGDFDLPTGSQLTYLPQYTYDGGNVTIVAKGNIQHLTENTALTVVADSEKELPNNWLYRRGYVDDNGQFGVTQPGDYASTTWWVDFSNFFEGVGALGGGNVTLSAGNSVNNVDAVIPTNLRVTYQNSNGTAADEQTEYELGGGDLLVQAGQNINGGVYYVEKGRGTLAAGASITTNATRACVAGESTMPQTWLPTTLFLGSDITPGEGSSFTVSAGGSLLLGPVANPFLLPEGTGNTYWYKTYFSTYGLDDSVNVSSLTSDVTLRESADYGGNSTPMLALWFSDMPLYNAAGGLWNTQTWLKLDETDVTTGGQYNHILFNTVASLMPPTLEVTAFAGDIDLTGQFILSPSPTGTLDLTAASSVNCLQPNGSLSSGGVTYASWGNTTIDLSDADPDSIPGVLSPESYQSMEGISPSSGSMAKTDNQSGLFLASIDSLFNETGATDSSLATQQALHSSDYDGKSGPLHADDTNPVEIYAAGGSISGLTLYSAKFADIIAGRDITDIAFYIQNTGANEITVVSAGGNLIPYDPYSPLNLEANSSGNRSSTAVEVGDIQISGPGTLEVLAGNNLELGQGVANTNSSSGIGVGISSVGGECNPVLLADPGANIVASAGIGVPSTSGMAGLAGSSANFTAFINEFLNPTAAESAIYLPDLGSLMGLGGETNTQIWTKFEALDKEDQDLLALNVFYLVLRDAGRDHNNPKSPGYGVYTEGFAAIAALFPGNKWRGNISLDSRDILTAKGGNISLFAPGGGVSLGSYIENPPPGIITEFGGNISIFTRGNVDVGVERIFTLRGGNQVVWSSDGSIAAGSSSKTVQTAPPTQVILDPTSANVEVNLAALATGGGIGTLEMVVGVPPSDVDLIAPNGAVNAGDAGIRVSGNLNIAAAVVLNIGNIQVGGQTSGVPVTVTPNFVGIAAASSAGAAAASNAVQSTSNQGQPSQQQEEVPPIVTVEVLGYGGYYDGDDSQPKKKKS